MSATEPEANPLSASVDPTKLSSLSSPPRNRSAHQRIKRVAMFALGGYRHVRTNAIVRKAYAGLIANQDVRPVDSATRKRIKAYARDVLGSSWYYPWLQLYTAYRGAFHEGWLPDDFIEGVLPIANTRYRNFSHARSFMRRVLQADHIPDCAYHLNGAWYDVAGHRIAEQQLRDIVFANASRAVVKMEESTQGKGIFILDERSFGQFRWPEGNFVVQSAVKQDPWFEQVSPGCVATLRITTVVPYGRTPQMRAAYLRVGRSGAQFVTSAAALRVPVIDGSGTLGPFASDPNWKRFRQHPDTGFKFEASQIPCFSDAVTLCETLHERVRQFTIIGWDIAISSDGEVKIMEFNTDHPDIKFTEASVGPSFVDLNLERLARR